MAGVVPFPTLDLHFYMEDSYELGFFFFFEKDKTFSNDNNDGGFGP